MATETEMTMDAFDNEKSATLNLLKSPLSFAKTFRPLCLLLFLF